MHVEIVKRPKNHEDNYYCLIPKDIYEGLDLSLENPYILHLGQMTVLTYVAPHIENNLKGYFPADIFNKLLLKSKIKLEIWREGTSIFLGPIVGILVTPHFLQSIGKNKLPKSVIHYANASEETHCLLYYFSINHINWLDEKIKAYMYSQKDQQWKETWLPFPNVIYDRGVFGFKSYHKKLIKLIRQQFYRHPNISYINEKDYLGKWELYSKLSKSKEMPQYLPETIRYRRFEDVKEMLTKHNFVFLKSYYGSLGKEVLSIRKLSSGYQVNYFSKILQNVYLDNSSSLKELIEVFMKERPFILQQGIDLYKCHGRNTDIRVLLQKNQEGKWQAIYNYVRIAPENQTITNSSTGGGLEKYENIYLLSLFNDDLIIPKDDEILEVAIDIAKHIEKAFGSFGELGIDLALDTSGKLWFIEANAKPGKTPVVRFQGEKSVFPQFLSVFQYAKYLVKEVFKNE